mgnify:CR=1 FL=1
MPVVLASGRGHRQWGRIVRVSGDVGPRRWNPIPLALLIVSVGVSLIGRALSRWLGERPLLWLLIGAWLLFYAVFFALMPN